ncbi:unnamed protein product, partial [Ranitomeya imitator]
TRIRGHLGSGAGGSREGVGISINGSVQRLIKKSVFLHIFTYRVPSVFFGGGTPSLASPSTIGAVLEAISKYAYLLPDAEITLEANPTSSGESKLQEFRDAGVNRLSVGVQSLDNHDLQLLGRTHTASDAQRTIEEARRIFPGRTSVDLMFGLPGQSLASWHSTLHRLMEQCDDHVSLYQLTLERGTLMFRWKEKAQLTFPDQELTAQMYEDARQILQEAGFRQYEVSNFARNGAVSKHNLSYWCGKQYIGMGPGAHGRFVVHTSQGKQRQARIQTLEPEPWMKEVGRYGHGTRKVTEQSDFDIPMDRDRAVEYRQQGGSCRGLSGSRSRHRWNRGVLQDPGPPPEPVPACTSECISELLVLGLRTDVGISHKVRTIAGNKLSPVISLYDLFEASQELRDLQKNGLLVLDQNGLRCTWMGLAVLDGLLLPILNQFQDSWTLSEKAKPHLPQTV